MDSIKQDIKDLNRDFFSRIPVNLSINENWNYFKENLKTIIEKHIPCKLSRTKNNLPWITRPIIRMQRNRNRLLKKASQSNKPKHMEAFKSFRNKTASAIRKSYLTYINEVIGKTIIENPKRFWSYVKRMNTKTMSIPTLVDDNEIHISDASKANALNQHFQKQFSTESSNLPNMPVSPYPSMPNINIGTEGIVKQLKEINPNKATGSDELPCRIYRDYAEHLSPMLAFIYQQSLDQCDIPIDWKESLVTAIHKKGSTSSPSNYRPISLTCIACKVLEHVVLSNINKHLSRHKLLSNKQHGFRASLSCATQLIESLHDWATSLNEQSSGRSCQVDAVLLDFSKAFDRVAHGCLLQ